MNHVCVLNTSLPEAVDKTDITITTGGNANWFGQNNTYYYGRMLHRVGL
ncbi:hypothetical protein MSIBF_A240002 [groundwater metagenome]|uniref:Uncharacterized protein n=1 Tax=groundwater metagenome TaxID=717931 RepID=A0A098E914_9ZZZZ